MNRLDPYNSQVNRSAQTERFLVAMVEVPGVGAFVLSADEKSALAGRRVSLDSFQNSGSGLLKSTELPQ